MKWFYNYLKNKDYAHHLENNYQGFANVTPIQEASLALSYAHTYQKPLIIVKENLTQAMNCATLISFLDPNLNVIHFDHEESLRVEAIASSPENYQLKLLSLYKIMNETVDIVVTSIPSIHRRMPKKETLHSRQINISIGDVIELDDLVKKLVSIGYNRTQIVEQPLSFSKRGGIIDVYSIQYKEPIRIEFFDNEIDSIRFFDVETQKSTHATNNITISVASDLLLTQEDKVKIRETVDKYSKKTTLEVQSQIEIDLSLFFEGIRDPKYYHYYALTYHNYSILDYFDDSKIIFSSRETVHRASKHFIEDSLDYLTELVAENRHIETYDLFNEYNQIIKKPIVYFGQFQNEKEQIQIPIHDIPNPSLEFKEHLPLILKHAMTSKVVLCVSEHELEKLLDDLIEEDVVYTMTNDHLVKGLNVCCWPLQSGFIVDNDIFVYSSKELFNHTIKKGRYEYQFKSAINLSGIAELKIGDYVVHRNYGVGKYVGLETKEINDYEKDFLKIMYAGDDVLLVPLEQFKLVRKFVSSEGVSIRLNKLGTNTWNKTKEKIKNSVNDIADKLIAIYKQRQMDQGFAFSKDNDLVKEFEAEFDYELTPDQKTAIKEMKLDMESSRPMDRLLCGDVGFGKTEVAIRGAFKAVVDEKQVVFLCPTTVLSQQHYRTFRERFKNYPVKIGLLNRFVEPNKQKEILRQVRSGQIDILIGTHRVLSKDVKYKDLGFLIIDEEQRFGVAQKEKIKELKTNVDVLSLSATPIPRTLQMSLINIRSLSQLNTPPNNRLPVVTHVIERNEKVIEDLIEREIARKGQVFYLYNRVSDIYTVAYRLQQKFPQAIVGVAHGKMSREEIEQVMIEFTNNDIQILVCTTIVETGIDIPNANTMIIDQADKFGLAQLYQIKGRVGRSDRLAYAYLMIDPQKQLSEIASKRLEAIKEFTQLGSGYKIAMRDLTIRGAGEILGGNQSGFIDTVGIDLYIELLNEAILEKQNKKIVRHEKPSVNIELGGYIPDGYVADDGLKIDLYQQIDKIDSLEQLRLFYEETGDRFGSFPKTLTVLLEKKQLELFLQEQVVDDYRELKDKVDVYFSKQFSETVDGAQFFKMVSDISKDIKLSYRQSKIILSIYKDKGYLSELVEVISKVREVYAH